MSAAEYDGDDDLIVSEIDPFVASRGEDRCDRAEILPVSTPATGHFCYALRRAIVAMEGVTVRAISHLDTAMILVAVEITAFSVSRA